MKRYIYHVVSDSNLLHNCDRRLAELMNEMADDGWEPFMVDMTRYPVVFFRREVEESQTVGGPGFMARLEGSEPDDIVSVQSPESESRSVSPQQLESTDDRRTERSTGTDQQQQGTQGQDGNGIRSSQRTSKSSRSRSRRKRS